MLHIVEVDQSGKVEDTKVATVLAFSDGITVSVYVPTSVKRNCIQILREWGLTGKSFYLRIFTILLFLLLKDHIGTVSTLYIDHEYVGHETEIKQQLLELFKKYGIKFAPQDIQFKYIGKESSAHVTAYTTFKGKRKPDRRITKDEILREFKELREPKKIGDPLRGKT